LIDNAARKILILNGPNLNFLGTREPDIYGHETLADIEKLCADIAAQHGMDVDCRQSNHEGELVTWIQEAITTKNSPQKFDAVIINAAAYTHTSVAIHDALKMLSCPIIEVHLSDPETREAFRHHSYISPIAQHIIKGQGADGYRQAIEQIAKIL
jgi:3-dehydroquinate dehydratase-2